MSDRVPRPPGDVPCQIWCCDPWDIYIGQLEADCRRHEIEQDMELDLERQRELRPPTERARCEYVEAELLPCVQRGTVRG
jgi:hypothetical protein